MTPLAAPPKNTLVGWLAGAVLVVGLIWAVLASPPSLHWIAGGAFGLIAAVTALHHRWLKRIRAERKEESICTFARTLPARAHDTWVVRAVYEEFSRHVGAPIRPSDNLTRFWGIDGDDLDDAMLRIAHRAGRSMADPQKNPWFDQVTTVADLISFLEQQPKITGTGEGARV